MALRVWLPLNGNLENKGISDYEIRSANITIADDGKIGKCYSFNGSNSYINITNFEIGNNWSYGCWVNTPNSDSRGWEIVMILNNSGSDADSQFAFWVHQKENRFESLANTQYVSTIPYTNYYNNWHHFFATFNGTLLTTYIDGNVVNTKTITATQYNAVNLTIGARSTNAAGTSFASWFQGKLNDIRVYDHCLSPLEVKEISQGLVLHYKLNEIVGDNLFLTNSVRRYAATAYDAYNFYLTENLQSNQTYTIQLWDIDVYHSEKTAAQTGIWIYWGGGSVHLGNWAGTSYFTQTSSTNYHADYLTKTFTITSSQSSGSGATNSWLVLYNSVGYVAGTMNMHVGKWKIQKGAIPTGWTPAANEIDNQQYISDSSGYGNDGVIINTISTESNSPRYKIATHIDNTSSKIKIDNLQTSGFGNSYTFAWWAKISSVTPMHWGFANGIRLNGMYTGRLWNTGDSSNNPLYNPGTTTQVTAPTVNTWHHWAMIGNGSKCLVYQDGQLWAEAKTYKAISGTTIYINGWDSSTSYCSDNLSISDFRIYATALSAEDIADLYHTPANIDNLGGIHGFEFEEAGNKDSIYKNGIISTGKSKNYLVNNFAETNTLTDWTFTSPTIANGVVTTTGTTPSITSKTFTVNPNDIIVVKFTLSMPTPSTSTSGQGLYLGVLGSANTNRYLYNFNTHTWGQAQSNASSSWNTYFLSGYNSTETITIKSYILGSSVDIANVPDAYCSLSRIASTNAIQLTSETTTNIRAGYNSGNTTMVIQLSNFEIYNLKENGIIQEEENAKTGLGYIKYSNIVEK